MTNTEILKKLEEIEKHLSWEIFMNDSYLRFTGNPQSVGWLISTLRKELAVNAVLSESAEFLRESSSHEMLCEAVFTRNNEDCRCRWKAFKAALSQTEKIRKSKEDLE